MELEGGGGASEACPLQWSLVQSWSRPLLDRLWTGSSTPKQRQRCQEQSRGFVESPAVHWPGVSSSPDPLRQPQLPQPSYLSMDPINWLRFQTGS